MSVAQWINRRQNEAVINDEKVRKNEVLLSFKHAKAFQEEIKPLNEGDKLFMFKFNNLYNEALFDITSYLQKYDDYQIAEQNGTNPKAEDYGLNDVGKFVLKYNKLANFLKQFLKNEPSGIINQTYLKMDELSDLVGQVLDADEFNESINILEKNQIQKIQDDLLTRNYAMVGHKGFEKKKDLEQEDDESLASGSMAGAGHNNLNGIYTGSSVPPFIFNWEKNDAYRRY